MTTKTDITQERAAFEAAYANAYPMAASRSGKFDREDWGEYVDASVGIGWRMWQTARAAVEADRQDRMPSDGEIDKLSHGFALQYQDHVRGFARALLSKYGNRHE